MMEVVMGLSPQLITKTLYEKAVFELKNLREDNRAAIRLRAIVSAKDHGVQVVAKVFDVTTNTLRSWVKSYAKEGLAGLYYKPGRGRKSHLQEAHYQAISEWTQADPNLTLEKMVLKFKQELDVDTSKSAVQRALLKLGMSYITPRPVHHKQDKSSHEQFKKKSKRGDGA
jgi:transposase